MKFVAVTNVSPARVHSLVHKHILVVQSYRMLGSCCRATRIEHLVFFLYHLLRLPVLEAQGRHGEHKLRDLSVLAATLQVVVGVGGRAVGSRAREGLSNMCIDGEPLVAICRVFVNGFGSFHGTELCRSIFVRILEDKAERVEQTAYLGSSWRKNISGLLSSTSTKGSANRPGEQTAADRPCVNKMSDALTSRDICEQHVL
ncbi:hypothetical protein IG631_23661 [Alternaria alternata]|nr:hypothetical protein IG631_23661 [Alternaria alternata]